MNASLDGAWNDPDAHQLADRVIALDAVVKLRLAASHFVATGTPFLMAVGFRKPHLPFRFPAPYLFDPSIHLRRLEDYDVASHRILDASVPAIAHCDKDPQADPYVAIDNRTAREWRLHYDAAVSWMDHQVGVVLDELDLLGRSSDTLVVFHADHGWSLGEHGEWQKFSNFEHGVRVPLIIRAPWIPQSVGARSSVLAELVDIFPTMAELAGIPLPDAEKEPLDGVSLASVLRAPTDATAATQLKPWALSMYPRCPVNASEPWRKNDCLFVDRSLFAAVGYTLRTADWRFTEWTAWDGIMLAPDHSPEGLIGVELYSHGPGSNGLTYSFNSFENVNQASSHPDVVTHMRALLHAAIANQTRISSLQQ